MYLSSRVSDGGGLGLGLGGVSCSFDVLPITIYRSLKGTPLIRSVKIECGNDALEREN